jgi:hypothetical protein
MKTIGGEISDVQRSFLAVGLMIESFSERAITGGRTATIDCDRT